MTVPERHAQRLLRWYPRVWRERYGDELGALLVDDVTDRPRSLSRDLDVVRAGLLARLSACGLARGPVQHRSAVVAVGTFAAVGFVGSAVSIWSQLANGWLTMPPDTGTVAVSLVALSIWLGCLLLLSAVVCVRIGVAVVRTCRTGAVAAVLRPLITLIGAGAVLLTGVFLVSPRWPGAQGAHRHGALASAARIGWASTDTISTYWMHPGRLLALSGVELAWMALSPVAIAALGWSVVRLLQAVRVSIPRAPWHFGCGLCLTAVPAVFSAAWVVSSQHASTATYRAGTLDLLLIAVMVATAHVGQATWRVARR